MKTFHKWILSLAGGICALLGLGLLYQSLEDRKDKKRFPPPGRLYDVAGLSLHAVCQGQGAPTVILEAGLSCTHLDWSRVLPAIAQKTRVLAYDRGGYGWSGPCSKPRNGLKMAAELHGLLQNAGISGPLILVGHSYGGLLVRLYASQYPQDVAGILLIDGSPENQREHFPRTKPWTKRLRENLDWQIYRLRPILARVGLLRLRNLPNGYIAALPEEVKPAATALGLSTGAYDWLRTEEPAIDRTNQEARSAILPDPVLSTVLVAGNSIPIKEYQEIWLRLQVEQSNKLPNCRYEVVEECGHFIHLEKPEKVIQAILEMVDTVRDSAK